MPAPSVQRAYAVGQEHAWQAVMAAIGDLGYTVLHSDRGSGMITFNSGSSMRSFAGQDMTATLFSEGARQTKLVLGGRRAQRGVQVYDWGEKGKITRRFLAALDSAVQTTPEPEIASGGTAADSTATAELERLAALHAACSLTDAEFQAAKPKVLGS